MFIVHVYDLWWWMTEILGPRNAQNVIILSRCCTLHHNFIPINELTVKILTPCTVLDAFDHFLSNLERNRRKYFAQVLGFICQVSYEEIATHIYDFLNNYHLSVLCLS